MYVKRTDLAMEAHDIRRRAQNNRELPGVRVETKRRGPVCTTVVQVLDAEGERAMGKARGTYLSMELDGRSGQVRAAAARQLAGHLRKLLPAEGPVMVVGLGNRAVTPDALGALTVGEFLITSHLCAQFPIVRSVSAICPGVQGQTGLESLEIVRAVAARVKPACLIAVDALAAAELSHIGAVIQLSDAGIQPGSGVGNRSARLDRTVLGVPVLALGVPTVTDLDGDGQGRIVTTADVDLTVKTMAKLLGEAVNSALHPGLSKDELDGFLM